MIRKELLRHVTLLRDGKERIKVASILKEMTERGELEAMGDSFSFSVEDDGFGISFRVVPYVGLFLAYTRAIVGLEKSHRVEYCHLDDSPEVSPSRVCPPRGADIARFSQVKNWLYTRFPREIQESFGS